MKDSMILYTAYMEKFRRLTDEQFGKLMRLAIEYQQTGIVPDIDDMAVSLSFDVVKYDIDKNMEKYNAVVKRNQENGKKGGRPRETEVVSEKPKKPTGLLQNPSEPKKPDNDNDNDNVNDNGTENDNGNDIVFTDNSRKKMSAKALTEEVVTLWNSFEQRGIIPKVNSLSSTSTRYKMLQARISEHGLENVLSAVRKVFESSFLKQSTWFSFDWFVKPNNFVKVSDGNYRDKEQPVTQTESRGFRAIREMDWGNDEQPFLGGQ